MYRLVEIKIRNTKYFIIFAGKEFSRRKYTYDSSILHLIYYFKSFCTINLENTYIFRSCCKSRKIVQELLKLSKLIK